MVDVYCVVIDVIDTTLPSQGGLDRLRYAQKGSVRLVYEGEDGKFQPIMASRLEFSLEVNVGLGAPDLHYKELFTGDERKFLVQMRDQDDNVMWEGFLLPDEYQEPYSNGTIYPSFKATENLGILKGVRLSNRFYESRQSVSRIIAQCLLETGLEYPLHISPAILNTGASGRYDQLFIDASIWAGDEQNDNCYDILESVLRGFGLTLWQQQQKWYLMGINHKGNSSSTVYIYDKDGVFQNTEPSPFTDTQSPEYLSWFSTPGVTLKPPFKTVSVVSGVPKEVVMFPSDLVEQKWTKTAEPQEPPYPKYWKGEGVDPEIVKENLGDYPQYVSEDISLTGVVAFQKTIENPTQTQVEANYISLNYTPYVKQGDKIAIDLTVKGFWGNEGGNIDFDQMILHDTTQYEISVGGTTLISNKIGFVQRDGYLLDITHAYQENVTTTTGRLEIDEFEIPSSGFMDVVFYHPTAIGDSGSGGTATHVTVDVCNISYTRSDTVTISRTRDLKRTNINEVSLPFGSSVLSTMKQAIVFQGLIPESELFELDFVTYVDFSVSGRKVGTVYGFTPVDYTTLQNFKDRLYIKREDSDFYEYVRDIRFIELGGLLLAKITLEGEATTAWTFAKLYYRTGSTTDPQDATAHEHRENFTKSTNATQENKLEACLAELRHDVYPESLVTMEGTSEGLLFPGDLISFKFDSQGRYFVVARIEMTIGQNETRVTAIEYKNEMVNDYII